MGGAVPGSLNVPGDAGGLDSRGSHGELRERGEVVRVWFVMHGLIAEAIFRTLGNQGIERWYRPIPRYCLTSWSRSPSDEVFSRARRRNRWTAQRRA